MSDVLDIGVYNSYGYATHTTIIIIMQVVSRLSTLGLFKKYIIHTLPKCMQCPQKQTDISSFLLQIKH